MTGSVNEEQQASLMRASGEHAASRPDLPVPLAAAAKSTDKLPRTRSPHAGKFRAALAALTVVAAVAIAAAIVVGTTNHGRTSVSQSWSAWSPADGGSTGVEEIAAYVAPFYRRSPSTQLNVVTPISLTSETAAGTTTGTGLTVAVNPTGSSSSSASSDGSLELLTGKTVAYNICGLNSKDCALSGTASTARMLLLRREALELALYTLRYIGSAQNVLVVLPPGHTVTSSDVTPTQGVTVSVLFTRAELQPLLRIPVTETLEGDPPDLAQVSVWSKSDEAGLVDQITGRGLFSSQVESQQEGGSVLVLSPLPSE